MTTWITADPHYNRYNANMGRPFADGAAMSEYLIQQTNMYVQRRDRLIIVGDFCWEKPGFWRQQINCTDVWLILGNHDKELQCRNVFGNGKVRFEYEFEIADLTVWAKHYPTIYWPGSHKGWGHVYGHTHAQREETLDQLLPTRRSKDVGVDNAFRVLGQWRPFHEEEIYNEFIARPGHDPLEFYHALQGKYDAFDPQAPAVARNQSIEEIAAGCTPPPEVLSGDSVLGPGVALPRRAH